MNYRIPVVGLITLCVAALHGQLAQAQASSQDIQIYAGYLFGDRMLEMPLSGSTPRLNDNGIFGARYTYHFTDMWGVQLSAGYSPSRAAHVASGDTNLGLTTVDLDLEWDALPDFQFAGHRLVPYTVIGVGYAWANLDHAMSGFAGTTPVTITDSNGYTANAGLGAKYYIQDNLFVGFDARYRYFSKLVSNFGQGMNTAETTLNVGYRFH
jgi:outer membrane beta-barrel protein